MKRLTTYKIHICVLLTICFHLSTQAQKLELLLAEAIKNSPEIRKVELQYQSIIEKTNEVGSLPNTEFGAGLFVSEPETRTGAQQFKLSVKQGIPWFGNLTSKKSYVNSLANAKLEDIAIAKRKLILEVSKSYYRLSIIQEKQKIVANTISLLKTYETMALTLVEIGKTSVVNVLKLQMRQNNLQQNLDLLQQQYFTEQTILNKLLNRKNEQKIELNEKLLIPNTEVAIDRNKLKIHPELIKYDKLLKSIEKLEIVNQKEQNPKLGIGLDYVQVAKRPAMDFTDNGKDIVMPMISISIPIFNKKHKSISKQNALKQLEIESEKQQQFNKLTSLLNTAINGQISAKISYKTQVNNLIQTKKAEQILLKQYETGNLNFNEILDIQELHLKFETTQLEAIKNYFLQSVFINYLTQ